MRANRKCRTSVLPVVLKSASPGYLAEGQQRADHRLGLEVSDNPISCRDAVSRGHAWITDQSLDRFGQPALVLSPHNEARLALLHTIDRARGIRRHGRQPMALASSTTLG